MKTNTLEKGKIYREKVDSELGYEDWEYTGRVIKDSMGNTLYAFQNDRGVYWFDDKDIDNYFLMEEK